jgi:hypothetical protein
MVTATRGQGFIGLRLRTTAFAAFGRLDDEPTHPATPPPTVQTGA